MSYSLVVPSNLSELENISIWLHAHLPKTLDETKKNHIILSAQEISTNAMLHGNKKDKSKTVSLELNIEPKNILLYIEDEGTEDFILPSKEESKEMDYLDEDGRGLKLAVLLSDAIELNHRQIKLIFNINNKL